MNMAFDRITDQHDLDVLGAIQDGLPLCERPYREIGHQLNMPESEVISRLQRLQANGIIKRFGLVMQHRSLGYRANAMVVFDIPDEKLDETAARIVAHDFVTLCYARTRQLPRWPFNLYCMIHGRERDVVERQIIRLKQDSGLENINSKTLFSRRRFKQTGARFALDQPKAKEAT